MRSYAMLVQVDPEPALALSSELRQLGYFVQHVTSADGALALLTQWCPDLLVVDLLLPRMSGLLLAEKLRRDKHCAEGVMIATTRLLSAEVEAVASASGFDRCLDATRPAPEVARDIHEIYARAKAVP